MPHTIALLAGVKALMTFDQIMRVLQVLALLGGARWILQAGMAMRDTVHDLKSVVGDMRGEMDDHENRIRHFEGKPERPSRRRTDIKVHAQV